MSGLLCKGVGHCLGDNMSVASHRIEQSRPAGVDAAMHPLSESEDEISDNKTQSHNRAEAIQQLGHRCSIIDPFQEQLEIQF